ncbi:MAG: endonuclease [Flavobacteriales bacterium]
MKKTLLFLIGALSLTTVFGQIPPGYYSSANGLTGNALKDALNDIIDDHVEFSYSAVKDALKSTDEDPANSNNVILLYKGTSQAKSTFGGGANDWNREHVWAKSHGGFGNSKPAGTDLHHLRPTDASVNSSRGNKDFDNGGNPHSEAVDCNSDSDSWEPRDEVKGDVARMLMYMAVRYEGESGEVDLELADQVNNGSTPFHGKLSTLLLWHANDPVSSFEENRNNVIYNSYQENRNPFIDHPEYANLIWGAPSAVEINSVNVDATPVYHQANVTFNVNTTVTNANITDVSVDWGTNGIQFPNSLTTTFNGTDYVSTPVQFNAGQTIYYKSIVNSDVLSPVESTVQNFEVVSPVGIQELNSNEWSFNEGILSLNLKDFKSISVINAIGQEIIAEKTPIISMQSLKNGVYFIKVQTISEYYLLKISL